MAVFSVTAGVVEQVWGDVADAQEFHAKYPDFTGTVFEGAAVPGMIWDGQALTNPTPSLASEKSAAMTGASDIARAVRSQIAGEANIERTLGWVLKAFFASAWQANDVAANPLLQPLADIAAAGFAIEANLTNETPEDVRDRSVEKAGDLFRAFQLVEGMERVAETQINAADTPQALIETITQLRALEAQALTQLAALQSA